MQQTPLRRGAAVDLDRGLYFQPEAIMNSNLDLVRGVYEAFAVGDIPSVLGVLAPDIHWTEAEGGPYGGLSIGPDAVLANVFMRLGGEWDGYAAVPREFVSDGATVVALGEYSGTYKATGKSFRAPFAHVWKFKGGKAVSFHQHTDTAVHRRPLQP
jgi:ketosteroid isomerase-like protein